MAPLRVFVLNNCKRRIHQLNQNIMKKLFFTFLSMMLILLAAGSIWAQTTELTGQTEPFYYNVPLSGLSMGVTALLILLFVAWRYLSDRRKTTT